MSCSLECPNCGQDGLFAREKNWYTEDETATCQECGLKCSIRVEGEGDEDDSGYVWVSHNDEYEDKGQPKCDGSCGSIKEFHGKPCAWNCERAKSAVVPK